MTTKRIQRNLTIMFTDISGFTKHTEKISRDQLMNRLDTHNKLLMPIVAHFEGKVIKTIGDAFLITFESPTNAVQCGTYMQYTLRKYNHGIPESEQIHIKVSINSGEVTATDNDVFGDAVNVAAKIEKATNPDEIYFTENVFLAMNKAEVPNAFVKTFRPRGENSNEIKLYKVVQDEADEVYKRIVEQTKIDPEKMKTRIIELSATAEKEYTRYQEALEALMEAQGKSSKTTVMALVGGVLVLAIVLLVGFFILKSGNELTPEQIALNDASQLMANGKAVEARRSLEQFIKEHGESGPLKDMLKLAREREERDAADRAKNDAAAQEAQCVKDARDYLKQGKTKDARTLVETYISKNGKTKALEDMLVEIADREFRDIGEEVNGLIKQGKPDQAKVLLESAVLDERHKKQADALKALVAHYLAAREFLNKADAEKAIAEVEAAFGQTNPSAEIESIRAKANAIIRARALLSSPDAKDNGAAAVALLVKSFGDNVPGSVLDLLVKAIEFEQCQLARTEGKEAVMANLEGYRTRFALPGSAFKQITREARLNALWYFTSKPELRDEIMNAQWSKKFFPEIWKLEEEFGDDADFMWRLGENLWDISDKVNRIPLGLLQYARAYKKNPRIIEGKTRFYDQLMEEMHYKQDAGISDSMKEEGIKEPIYDARFYVRKFYFKKARPDLIAGLTALMKKQFPNDKDQFDTTFNCNCFAVLADMGEASLVGNRFEFFRDIMVHETLSDSVLQPEHFKALFAESMSFDEYKQYRALLDELKQEAIDGKYQAYSLADDVIANWLVLLKEAQPQHTAEYSK